VAPAAALFFVGQEKTPPYGRGKETQSISIGLKERVPETESILAANRVPIGTELLRRLTTRIALSLRPTGLASPAFADQKRIFRH
jgi:hypothetical protein